MTDDSTTPTTHPSAPQTARNSGWALQTRHTRAAARTALERAAGTLLPRQFDITAALSEYRAALVCRLPDGYALDDTGLLRAPANASTADVSQAVTILGNTYERLEPVRILAAHRYRRVRGVKRVTSP